MTTFTITIPDADVASVTATVCTVPPGSPPEVRPAYRDAAAWVTANVKMLVAQCVDAQKAKKAHDAGLASLSDLTEAEIATIKAARDAAKVAP